MNLTRNTIYGRYRGGRAYGEGISTGGSVSNSRTDGRTEIAPMTSSTDQLSCRRDKTECVHSYQPQPYNSWVIEMAGGRVIWCVRNDHLLTGSGRVRRCGSLGNTDGWTAY
ncbi:hypothetical protein Bbelb_112590 [Branchiostoma belcheri]|nr:hypothetical protein Bbelb_112590 [Branchiostoma belcheri]